MKLIDVNVLLYVVNRRDDRHERVFAWWSDALKGQEAILLPWVVISGFLRISTTRKIFANPLEPDDAIGRVQAWLDHPQVATISENDAHWRTMSELVRQHALTGKMVTDAHLAALAISRGASLVSCDRDFTRFRHLRWENPAA